MYFISPGASEFKYTVFNICNPTTDPLFVCRNEKCVAAARHFWNQNITSNLSRAYYSKIFSESWFLLPQTLYSSGCHCNKPVKRSRFLFFQAVTHSSPPKLSASLWMGLKPMSQCVNKINMAVVQLKKNQHKNRKRLIQDSLFCCGPKGLQVKKRTNVDLRNSCVRTEKRWRESVSEEKEHVNK